MSVLKKNFTYIDLFAGIGGFRLAMTQYSSKSKCLFASEINPEAAQTYELNFKQKPLGDIRTIDPIKLGIPVPDVVCGGFPCQTFSKGGSQAGFKDSRGTLFREIVRIIEAYEPKKRPKILILENVQNLLSHDDGNTWKTIYKEISDVGYNVMEEPLIVSPKDFGVPQLRSRTIILAVREDIYDGKIELRIERNKTDSCSIKDIIENDIDSDLLQSHSLTDEQIKILDCWNDFIQIIPKEERVIGFPIWSDEFGKRYSLKKFPDWKQQIISRNRQLYKKYKPQIKAWFKKWKVRDDFTPTNRKFEWQAGASMDSVYDGIIQFRTSGIRVKRPTESPALVAMDHRPIYGPQKRYIIPVEGLRLQSFPDDYQYDENEKQLFKQLGNAVNVKVIENVFRLFVEYIDKNKKRGK